GAETESLIEEFSQGRTMNDVQMIARLSSLIVAALKAPMPDSAQLSIFAAVLDDAGASEAFGLPQSGATTADTATLHSTN
ncbi:MAG: TetR/AcrR family transcriptional regulator, partial [Burkholderia sp.]|nr:TetR/AcrR family transcriptional regulator [Burkholderia sp.]